MTGSQVWRDTQNLKRVGRFRALVSDRCALARNQQLPLPPQVSGRSPRLDRAEPALPMPIGLVRPMAELRQGFVDGT